MLLWPLVTLMSWYRAEISLGSTQSRFGADSRLGTFLANPSSNLAVEAFQATILSQCVSFDVRYDSFRLHELTLNNLGD